MNKIRKGDTVVVNAGRDKGRTGTVIKVDGDKVVVENLNIVKKHQKPNPQKGEAGGIKQMEAPLHVSNVALWNPATKKADRVGVKTLENGRKVRCFKSNGEVVDA
ncbi:MAG: 50S ribosomal protein L24 [Steroidobacteraceae bacterium]|nr:50S ribosomal protein L24 [Steroidobacteraceae bacterium]MCC7199549.1 50S ribosomal protein L24 [Gammaproteobacteria bacterium]